jgi:hypothetical protein
MHRSSWLFSLLTSALLASLSAQAQTSEGSASVAHPDEVTVVPAVQVTQGMTPASFVNEVNVLETSPLMDHTVIIRQQLVQWLRTTPSVSVTVSFCEPMATWGQGLRNGNAPAYLLFTQQLLELAAVQITHPHAASKDIQVTALANTLRMYGRVTEARPDLSDPTADRLWAAYQTGGDSSLLPYVCPASAPTSRLH